MAFHQDSVVIVCKRYFPFIAVRLYERVFARTLSMGASIPCQLRSCAAETDERFSIVSSRNNSPLRSSVELPRKLWEDDNLLCPCRSPAKSKWQGAQIQNARFSDSKFLKSYKEVLHGQLSHSFVSSPGRLRNWKGTGVELTVDKRFFSTSLFSCVCRKPSCRGFHFTRENLTTAVDGGDGNVELQGLTCEVKVGARGVDENVVEQGSTSEVEDGARSVNEKVVEQESTVKVEDGARFDLPKFENSTMDLIDNACKVIDSQAWGSKAIEELENLIHVFTPFLIQQIITKLVGNPDKAWSFFQWARVKVGRKVSVSAHVAILDVLGRAKRIEMMKLAFALTVEDGYRMRPWPYNIAVKWSAEAGDVNAALYFRTLMKENNCKPTVATYNHLIDLLSKEGRHKESIETFKDMLEANCPPNIGTYNVLMNAYGVSKQPEVAAALFNKLSELGCKPNYVTYRTLISLHLKAGKPDLALKYLRMMKAAGMEIGNDVYKILRTGLPVARATEALPPEGETKSSTTRDTLESQLTDVNPPNIDVSLQGPMTTTGPSDLLDAKVEIVSSASLDGNILADVSPPDIDPRFRGRIVSPVGLVQLLQSIEPKLVKAQLDKIRPIVYPRFVVLVLQRIPNTESALIFFDWVKTQPYFKHNEHTYSTMITVLGRSRNNEAVARILREMQDFGIKMNTPIFTALITSYGRAKSIEGALKLFDLMKEWGCMPDVITYTSVIHLLTKHGCYELALDKFEEMLNVGIEPNVKTYSVIVYHFVKAGKIFEAVSLLKDMPGFGCIPTAITFASIIDHCAKEGHVDLALDLYHQMEVCEVKPLRATVSTLDEACRKAGKLDEAKKITDKFRRRPLWDANYKAATRKLAQELLV